MAEGRVRLIKFALTDAHGLDGESLVTNFTAVAATFSNIGPSLDGMGPTANFGLFSILILFVPETWRKF